MTKQEFMAMSLPYALHMEVVDYKSDYVGKQYDLLIGILQWSKDGDLWCVQTVGGARPSFDRVKPILHPLSDLAKEIEHNGEKFVPIDRLYELFGYEIPMFNKLLLAPIACEPFNCVKTLLEWHFDIANLIEKGEAIDINSLEINPYK